MKLSLTLLVFLISTCLVTGQDLIVDGRAQIQNTTGSISLEVLTTNEFVAKFESSSDNQTVVEIVNTSSALKSWSLITKPVGRFDIDETGVAPRMTFLQGGLIGVNFTNPNDALDVVGDIDATGCVQTGDTGAIGGTCISDRRYKKNIIGIENQLSQIMKLNPVSFDWKDPEVNGGQSQDIGLIAQEVEEVIPEMVVTGDDGYKRIKYDIALQMRMIRALQEQQEMIDKQQSQILEMQSQITSLLENNDSK